MKFLLGGLFLMMAAALVVGALKVDRLRLCVKTRDPVLFRKLGSPMGTSPPDSRYGPVEFQRFLYRREFRQCADPEVRRVGESAWRWSAAAAAMMAMTALALLVEKVFG